MRGMIVNKKKKAFHSLMLLVEVLLVEVLLVQVLLDSRANTSRQQQ